MSDHIDALDLVLGGLSTLGGVGAAVAAFGAWYAATQSNKAAATMADIERARHHADLTPQLRITGRETSNNRAELAVTFDGPVGLDRLDAVTLEIRDDRHDRQLHTRPGKTTIEQIAAQVFGPYQLIPGVDGADATGRTTAPIALNRGEGTRIALRRTTSPDWSGSTDDDWRNEWSGAPVRIILRCYRDGYETWTVPDEVAINPGPATARSTPGDNPLRPTQRLSL